MGPGNLELRMAYAIGMHIRQLIGDGCPRKRRLTLLPRPIRASQGGFRAMVRVTMNLTDQDIANVEALTGLPSIRNKTHAISVALAFARHVADSLQSPDAHLLLRDGKGNLERIVMPELQAARPRVIEPVRQDSSATVPAHTTRAV